MRGERGGNGRPGTNARSLVSIVLAVLLVPVGGCDPTPPTPQVRAAGEQQTAPQAAPPPVTARPPADPAAGSDQRATAGRPNSRPPGAPRPTASTGRNAAAVPTTTAPAPSTGPPVPSGFEGVRPAAAARPEYPVGRRLVPLSRGRSRPLPTTVWYPAVGTVGTTPATDARVHPGRFPLVLLSHGLHGLPEDFTALAAGWAAAGFVVAAPAYPRTNRRTTRFRRADIVHQPDDAAHVIRQIGRLDTVRDDPLAGHLDRGRVAAVGHSAGGFTTTGLFHARHSPALRAAVIIAGWGGRTTFDGPQARMLFVHGSADTVVPPDEGWAVYDRVPWPRAFLTLPDQGHSRFLRPGNPAYARTATTVTDFLRWTLQDDLAARRRLGSGARPSGVPGLETGPRW